MRPVKIIVALLAELLRLGWSLPAFSTWALYRPWFADGLRLSGVFWLVWSAL